MLCNFNMESLHYYFLNRKRPCRQNIFRVMLLFFVLIWCCNCPVIHCATEQGKPNPAPIILKDGSTINFSLLNYDSNTLAGKVLDDSSILLPSTTVTVNINQIPPSIKFLVIQAHSFVYNITLSYNQFVLQSSFASGFNIGLVQFITNQNAAQFFLLNTDATNNVSVLVAVQGYGRDAPIPGGCNMEAAVENAPFLGVGFNDSVVWVDIPPPSASNPGPRSCERQQTEVEMYHMYLPERNFSAEAYFQALKTMMSVQDVRRNGKKVEFALEGPRVRRVFSSYPGTGSVYGVIAIAGFSGAAYVPAITYSCSIGDGTDSCNELTSTFTKLLCAISLFLGLFVCFFGHRFFKTTMILLGFLAGGLVSYIMIALQESTDVNETVVFSVLAGIVVGIVWLFFWCCCGIPVLSVLPAMLTLGYVVAAIAMYSGVGDYQIFESDFNYWILFICIALSVPILLVSHSRMANIFCCAILGAYAVVVPIDHYIGSNLKFILFNTIRRATVKHFSMAVIDPPFQTNDMVLCAVWFGLATLGILFQWIRECGKPPFPAPPFRNRGNRSRRHHRTAGHDRTPLITDASNYYGSISTNVGNAFMPPSENRRFTILPKFPPTAPVW